MGMRMVEDFPGATTDAADFYSLRLDPPPTPASARPNIRMGEPDPTAVPGQCHVKMTIFAGDGSVLKAAEGAVEEDKNSSILFPRPARFRRRARASRRWKSLTRRTAAPRWSRS